MKRQPSYTVAWVQDNKCRGIFYGMPRAIDFYTRKKALEFFNDHRKDENKFGMHVIHFTYDSIDVIAQWNK